MVRTGPHRTIIRLPCHSKIKGTYCAPLINVCTIIHKLLHYSNIASLRCPNKRCRSTVLRVHVDQTTVNEGSNDVVLTIGNGGPKGPHGSLRIYADAKVSLCAKSWRTHGCNDIGTKASAHCFLFSSS